MTGVVVDTGVVSYLFKRDTRAALYAKHLSGRPLHVAFATVAELYRWAVFNGWGQPRIDALGVALSKYGVLVYDDAMAWEWARHVHQRPPYGGRGRVDRCCDPSPRPAARDPQPEAL